MLPRFENRREDVRRLRLEREHGNARHHIQNAPSRDRSLVRFHSSSRTALTFNLRFPDHLGDRFGDSLARAQPFLKLCKPVDRESNSVSETGFAKSLNTELFQRALNGVKGSKICITSRLSFSKPMAKLARFAQRRDFAGTSQRHGYQAIR